MSLLERLRAAGMLRQLDHALALSLRRNDPATGDEVASAAALASLAVSAGHAGFALDQPQALVQAEMPWPPASAWAGALQSSPWVAMPADADLPAPGDTPLVLEHGLLYLRRYREYERRLVAGLHRLGGDPVQDDRLADVAAVFARLFPNAGADDRQARAAALALLHRLLLVTGGPGTGKTTTIARVLVLLGAQARARQLPAPRIALAAPTGRAAERMAESLRKAAAQLAAQGIEPELLEPLSGKGSTLHRLLGTRPDSPQFRHNADNRLQVDVVVVDEASMIDLPLMAKLVEAVPDGAHLILLGDPDQLPSVEAGDVLSGILAAAGDGLQLDAADAQALQPLLGAVPADAVATAQPGAPFPARHVHLLRGWRQSAALDLAPLSAAVRVGDADQALALLAQGLEGVHYHPEGGDPLADPARRAYLLEHWSALAQAPTPAAALALAGRLRLLTAVREGPQGARGLNPRIEALLRERLAQHRTPSREDRFFHGRLLLVTENSYRHGLFNGDIGICLDDGQGQLMAWFPGTSADAPRAFHPATLPAHDSAFAMTVHKAQGSEFNEVWLVLPDRDSRVLSRELVYTGMTRARDALHLLATPTILAQSLGRNVSRISGLGWRLSPKWKRVPD
jgi:exodeoxyribonuclease V alpha subunit